MTVSTALQARADRLLRYLGRLFMERQVLLRSDGRVRVVTLGPRVQCALLAVLLMVGGWIVHASIARIESARVIAEKDHEIGALKLAFRSLRNDVDRSEARFKALARTLEAKHAYLVARLGPQVLGFEADGSPDAADGDDIRAGIDSARNELLAQLGRLEMVMQGAARSEGRDARARADVEERLRLSTADRARLDRDRRGLIERLERLEARLAALNLSQRGFTASLATRTDDRISKVKTLIASTGVNVEALLARLGEDQGRSGRGPGVGGPFVAAESPASSGRAVPASLGRLDYHLGRLEDVRRLARVLPLAAPSDHFYVASTFGKRRDPVNGRWAVHHGADLAGVYRSPVAATAPGVVTYVGWNGNYGRMVEVDHGMGIRTRYGHLHRALVRKGQKVELGQKVGEMGSTGRSTGVHVHYEVLVNGKPRDPLKFIQAGEHVLKGF